MKQSIFEIILSKGIYIYMYMILVAILGVFLLFIKSLWLDVFPIIREKIFGMMVLSTKLTTKTAPSKGCQLNFKGW